MTRSKAELETALRHDPNDHAAFSEYVARLAGGGPDDEAPAPIGTPSAPSGPARNADLEARLLENPDDDESWQVYVDWLINAGDPRGELGALQMALAGPPGPNAAAQLERESLLLSELGDVLLPASVREATTARERPSQLGWRAGFVESAELIATDSSPTLETQLADLLSHAAGRFLRDLELGAMGPTDHDYRDLVALVADAESTPLRKLFIASFGIEDSEISWSNLGHLGGVWAAHPNLEEVVIRGGRFELGSIDLPRARSFAVRTGGLWAANIRAIVGASWPSLSKLELWFGSSGYGAEASVELLEPLLAGTGFDALTDLGLMNGEIADDLAAALPDAAIAPQLERLDLSMGILTNRGAVALADGAARFTSLEALDVSDSYLGPAGEQTLRDAFDGIALLIGAQQGDDMTLEDADGDLEIFYEDRYVQVGE